MWWPRNGEGASGKGTICGAERPAGGIEFSFVHTAGQDLRIQAGLVRLQQEAFLGPPFLFSVSGTVSNGKVWRGCFPFQRAVCPGAKAVVRLYLPC